MFIRVSGMLLFSLGMFSIQSTDLLPFCVCLLSEHLNVFVIVFKFIIGKQIINAKLMV